MKASTYSVRVLSQYDQTIHANFKRVHSTYVTSHYEQGHTKMFDDFSIHTYVKRKRYFGCVKTFK